MKYYIDITLLPSADIGHHFLWTKVYQQIHLALVETQDAKGNVPVGIALPEYNEEKYQLGSKVRLLALDEAILVKLDIHKWLNRFSDYVHLTQIRPVPDRIKSYAIYKRQQLNRSHAKLNRTIKRKAERDGISLEDADKIINPNPMSLMKDEKEFLKFPFIQINSLSTAQKFRLFIEKKQVDQPTAGSFSLYGLSTNATVPEF